MNRRAILAGAAVLPAASIPVAAGTEAYERELIRRWQKAVTELDASGAAFTEACENGGDIMHRHAHDPVFRAISDRYDAAWPPMEAVTHEIEQLVPATPIGLAAYALACREYHQIDWSFPLEDEDYDIAVVRRLVERLFAFAGVQTSL
jgi:hypothetical protein